MFTRLGKKSILFFCSLGVIAFEGQSWGWGRVGHELVATTGSVIMSPASSFWSVNKQNMGTLTNVPDNTWKLGRSANTEKPMHFFQPDSYYSDPSQFYKFPHSYSQAVESFGLEQITENGTAPWRIRQLYELAVKAFKKGDYALGLQMAGTLSHYVGDLSQPLHVTENYDGANTGNPGIHKFFETDNLEKADQVQLRSDVESLARTLLQNSQFKQDFSGDILDIAFREIDRSFAYKDRLITIDKTQGRSGAGAESLLKMAKLRLADGAATLAIILQKLTVEAGIENQGASISVKIPAWVAPDFEDDKRILNSVSREGFLSSLQEDDCEK